MTIDGDTVNVCNGQPWRQWAPGARRCGACDYAELALRRRIEGD